MSSMTTNHIFKRYFRKKLLLGMGLAIVAIGIRFLSGHETSILFSLGFISLVVMAMLAIGFIDYHHYKNTEPKFVAELLLKTPLIEFNNHGFETEDDDKLIGQIASFKVILSPLINNHGNIFLSILIPIQLKDGLEKYFDGFSENFKLTISGEVVFVKALLKDYDKKYNHSELLGLINSTIINLKDKKIEPLEIEYDSTDNIELS